MNKRDATRDEGKFTEGNSHDFEILTGDETVNIAHKLYIWRHRPGMTMVMPVDSYGDPDSPPWVYDAELEPPAVLENYLRDVAQNYSSLEDIDWVEDENLKATFRKIMLEKTRLQKPDPDWDSLSTDLDDWDFHLASGRLNEKDHSHEAEIIRGLGKLFGDAPRFYGEMGDLVKNIVRHLIHQISFYENE